MEEEEERERKSNSNSKGQIEKNMDIRPKTENHVSQLRLSEQRPLLVLVHVFVDRTNNRWDYSAVNIFVAIISKFLYGLTHILSFD